MMARFGGRVCNGDIMKQVITTRDVRRAIVRVKRDDNWRNGTNRNPDVLKDTNTGEVYPITPSGGYGDPIGNICAKINVPPTRCLKKGELLSKRNPNSAVRKHNIWLLHSKLSEQDTIDLSINLYPPER